MFKVISCLAFEHDIRYVLVAAVLCALSSVVALSLLHRARMVEGMPRLIWLATGSAAGGFGIWATHFVAMLAYDPGIVVGYESTRTLGSLVVAILSTCAASAVIVLWRDKVAAVGAGAVFGAGVSSMHFVGMSGLEFPGYIQWDFTLVASALSLAVVFSIPAFYIVAMYRHTVRATLVASGLMLLGIVSMHFTAMGAVTVVPDPTRVQSADMISPLVLTATIAAVAFSMLFAGLTAAIFAVRAETIAEAGEAKFRLLVQGVTDYALYMLDTSGHVTNWNKGAERAKGYKEAEVVGEHYSIFYTPEERAAGLPQKNLRIAEETGKFEGEGWRVRKDGTRIWAHVVIDAIRDEEGRLLGFAKITRDRTEHMLGEARLKKAASDLQLALNNMANALALFDGDGMLLMHNRRLNEILGLDNALDLTGTSLEVLGLLEQAGKDRPAQSFRSLVSGGSGERIAELANGKTIRISYMPTESTAWVFTVEDITARVNSERRIAHLARHDVLTGLPNRRHFNEVLDRAMAEAASAGSQVAVINIDLDRFKDINDTYGHAAGDEVLCILSERLRHALHNDETVGRFGGDEFVAMKPFDHMDELHDFIARLEKALTGLVTIDVNEFVPGASLGVAIYPLDAPDREKLLSNADMAMYRAKESFDEKVCFYEAAMDEAERARRMLAMDIWKGLKEEQFYLNYQVQRSAATHEITGHEVLLRWNHPVRGSVSPVEFIPIAEECGAIAALGEWVLQRACEDAAAGRVEGKIAVNLSPLQLTNVHLIDKVREVLQTTGLPPARLELEVTESAIIGDKLQALHLLRQIRAMGVTIALDDFGTGYSSLETLRSFPFDKIKLDRSFVTDLDSNRQSRAFIRAILALGKSLEIPVLAEGIETERQMSVLTDEGCDLFQGYLFGRPMRLDTPVIVPQRQTEAA